MKSIYSRACGPHDSCRSRWRGRREDQSIRQAVTVYSSRQLFGHTPVSHDSGDNRWFDAPTDGGANRNGTGRPAITRILLVIPRRLYCRTVFTNPLAA